jgi:cyclin H
MTDVYFLYTPSQIWLSAFLIADRPLAEFLLDVKLGGPVTPATATPETSQNGLQNPLYEIRCKLHRVLTDCTAFLQSYTPLSSDPAQMKSLKRIAKKLYHCQNPEKANIAAQKRESAQPSTAVTSESGMANSESESERLAKKRKLEQEQKSRESNDVFGPELVTQRTKEHQ